MVFRCSPFLLHTRMKRSNSKKFHMWASLRPYRRGVQLIHSIEIICQRSVEWRELQGDSEDGIGGAGEVL